MNFQRCKKSLDCCNLTFFLMMMMQLKMEMFALSNSDHTRIAKSEMSLKNVRKLQ